MTFSYERELGQSPWSQQVLPTVFSLGREDHVTGAGCHSCASNVARPPPQAKNGRVIGSSPYPFPTVYFYLLACPPPLSLRSVTLLDHVMMSGLRVRSEILRMPPKIKPFDLFCCLDDGEGFSVGFTNQQQTGAGARFLKLLQLHQKPNNN